MSKALGRPPKGPISGKSTVMSLRLQPETRAMLEAAATASGNSLSQEAETRMLDGLKSDHLNKDKIVIERFGSIKTYTLMRTAATIAKSMVNLKRPNVDWTQDPYLYRQIELGIGSLLQALRPQGDPPQEIEDQLDHGGALQWKMRVFEALNQIRKDPDQLRLHEPFDSWVADRIRSELGEIVDRIQLPATPSTGTPGWDEEAAASSKKTRSGR